MKKLLFVIATLVIVISSSVNLAAIDDVDELTWLETSA